MRIGALRFVPCSLKYSKFNQKHDCRKVGELVKHPTLDAKLMFR